MSEEAQFNPTLWCSEDPKKYFLQIKTLDNLKEAASFNMGSKTGDEPFFRFHFLRLSRLSKDQEYQVKKLLQPILAKWYEEIKAWHRPYDDLKKKELKDFIFVSGILGFGGYIDSLCLKFFEE